MVPSVFLSSTIADLHYLRDGLRDAIIELSYQPVMSEYGEIGYLNPNPASESCYRTVAQCNMVVLIVGKRYGWTSGADSYSVTHNEFLAAKDNDLPIITFVEQQVLNYKDVYEVDPNADMWKGFPAMDNPKMTFQLLDDINRSPTFNGIIPFTNVADAKNKLKLQIADLVGFRLSEQGMPVSSQIKDVLAELSTLRSMLVNSQQSPEKKDEARKHLEVTKILLSKSNYRYYQFLNHLLGDFDLVNTRASESISFSDLINRSDYRYTTVDDDSNPRKFSAAINGHEAEAKRGAYMNAEISVNGGYAIFQNKFFMMSSSLFLRFQHLQRDIFRRTQHL